MCVHTCVDALSHPSLTQPPPRTHTPRKDKLENLAKEINDSGVGKGFAVSGDVTQVCVGVSECECQDLI